MRRSIAKDASDGKEVDVDERMAGVFAKCITGWKNLEENGSAVKISEKAAKKLLTTYPWVLDQVQVSVEKRSNFTEKL